MLSVLIICKSLDEVYGVRQSLGDLDTKIFVDVELPASTNMPSTYIYHSKNLGFGERKRRLINQVKEGWILLLDSDERVSEELLDEIKLIVKNKNNDIHGYSISYQNYVFGKPVYFGGEAYSKIRLFQKKYGTVTKTPIHEEVVVNGAIGKLSGVIHHYSYRNILQVLIKFTKYARLAAEEKRKSGERATLKKLLFYGPHMFWARAFHDEGWRDGWRGVILALLFGYMESLTYWFLLLRL